MSFKRMMGLDFLRSHTMVCPFWQPTAQMWYTLLFHAMSVIWRPSSPLFSGFCTAAMARYKRWQVWGAVQVLAAGSTQASSVYQCSCAAPGSAGQQHVPVSGDSCFR